jgi:lipoyl(octanoyl) transferase
MHGLCFNVNPDLSYFNHIIPCGIKNKGITSLQELKKGDIDINEVKLTLIKNFKLVFNAEINFEAN